jgi:hypothetical protein
MIGQAHRQYHGARRVPSSSAYQCPSRSHRIKGAYGVARDRFASLDPPTTHQGFSAYEEEGERSSWAELAGTSGDGVGERSTHAKGS